MNKPYEPRPIQVNVKELFDKPQAQAIEAEIAVLGSMMTDHLVIGDVLQQIGPIDFFKPAHQAIAKTIFEMYESDARVDIITVASRLQARNEFKDVGGADYLNMLCECSPGFGGSAITPYHAKIVRERAIVRRLSELHAVGLQNCYDSPENPEQLLDDAERAIFALRSAPVVASNARIGQLMQDTYTGLENKESKMGNALSMGFYKLDEVLGGIRPGELIILAGRPSMGKSVLSTNIAEHVAIDQKKAAVIFSLEMSKEELGFRIMSSQSGVGLQKIRRHQIDDLRFHDLQMAIGRTGDAMLEIDDTPGLTITQLRAKARRYAAAMDLKLIVVDYIQLMSAPKSDSREQEVSSISRGLKAIAKELKVPVIAVAQLNRAVESREGNRPRMSDLRESGSLEQDADVVLMCYREDYYKTQKGGAVVLDGLADVIIAKQRNGALGTVNFRFDNDCVRFQNLEERLI